MAAEIQRLGFTVLGHPTCSPDLATSDFHLFPKLKKYLVGYHFYQTTKSRQVKPWFRQQDTSVVTNSKNYLNVGENVRTAEVIMLSERVNLQNKV
jgi:hypothetical protein